MAKILAAALLAVIAIEPLRFNGGRYAPGDRAEGLTKTQADELVAIGHARLPTDDDEGGANPEAEEGSGDGSDTNTKTNTPSAGNVAVDKSSTDTATKAAAAKTATKAPAKTAAKKTAAKK